MRLFLCESHLGDGLPLLSNLAKPLAGSPIPRSASTPRRDAGRAACPSVVIMDGQSVTTTERGGDHGFRA